MSNPVAISEVREFLFSISPLLLVSAWLMNGLNSSKRDRMQAAFKAEVKRTYYTRDSVAGHVSLLDFCLEARVSVKTAKRFLGRQVTDFAGVVDVDQFGDLQYYFGEAKAKFLEAEQETGPKS